VTSGGRVATTDNLEVRRLGQLGHIVLYTQILGVYADDIAHPLCRAKKVCCLQCSTTTCSSAWNAPAGRSTRTSPSTISIRACLSPQWISDLRNICLTELSALYATEMFLRDFYTDIDFCSFVSIWFYEEMKHHLTLRKYLERCGETFDEAELPVATHLRAGSGDRNPHDAISAASSALPIGTRPSASRAPEPVIRKIFKILAPTSCATPRAMRVHARAVANKPRSCPTS